MAASVTALGSFGPRAAGGVGAGTGGVMSDGSVPRPPVRRTPVRWVSAPPAALDLLSAARRGLSAAALLADPCERYAVAHLAALRTAAAVLAARAKPDEGPVRRRAPRSAWELLPRVAPELTEWAAFFAAGARKRAAAEAGLPNAATAREADDLVRDAESFWRLTVRLLGLPAPVAPEVTETPDAPGGAA